MTVHALNTLLKRANRLQLEIEKHQAEQQQEQEVMFETYWGDEEIPEDQDGVKVFHTTWSMGKVEGEEV